MAAQPRESVVADRIQRAATGRRVFPYLVVVTVGLAVVAGFVVTVVDRSDFPTFGDGVWWAIVTLGTVGYGDLVPRTAAGRVVGSAVIVFGVTFIAFLTAVVTSTFVSADQARSMEAEKQRRATTDDEMLRLLREASERLAAIEPRLDQRD